MGECRFSTGEWQEMKREFVDTNVVDLFDIAVRPAPQIARSVTAISYYWFSQYLKKSQDVFLIMKALY